jgi:energy-dependent translational throttle protein EttA
VSSPNFVFTIKGLTKNIGGKPIIKDVWLSFIRGARIGVIGHNGSGKSTLMRIVAGTDTEFEGEAWPAKDITVGYLEQEPKLDSTKSVFENILLGLEEKKKLLDDFDAINEKFSTATPEEFDALLAEQTRLQDAITETNAWNLKHEISVAMNALSCPAADTPVSFISGGEKRRVALCKLLLQKPDMLLLDEPTNHLDAQSVAWLENHLKGYAGTVVLITHDRYFLDNVVDWILEIDNKRCVPWHSNYSSWLEQKYQKFAQESQQQSLLTKQIDRELKWIREGKHTRNKARVKAYEAAVEQQTQISQSAPQIVIPDGPRLGDVAVHVECISKAFGNKQLFENFSCDIPPGSVVGIIGPNGAGKSTFLNMITGKEKPDKGHIELGQTVKLGYVDQSREDLDPNKTVWEEIAQGLEEVQLGKRMIKTRAYCAAFNFKGDAQQKLVGSLSGGERNRVHMAKLLKQGANVILLDEPSNDLDIETLRNLEEAILQFQGCMLIVSHDRWFLDRITTHIMDFTSGEVCWFEGNYSEYKAWLAKTGESREISKKQIRRKLT